jgi:hypothetical protein
MTRPPTLAAASPPGPMTPGVLSPDTRLQLLAACLRALHARQPLPAPKYQLGTGRPSDGCIGLLGPLGFGQPPS